MISQEINDFRRKLTEDAENREIRRSFHENYEWLESYWQQKFNGNNGEQQFCNMHHEFYWQIEDIKIVAKEFAVIKPVGNSNNNNEPTEHTLRATYFLKYHAQLFLENELPTNQEQIEKANNWNDNAFKAIFDIGKQIRNNLFHGRKMDLEEEQYRRDKLLITLATKFTSVLLDNLTQAENGIN